MWRSAPLALLLSLGCAAQPPPPKTPGDPLPSAAATRADCRPNPYLALAREQYSSLAFEEMANSLQRALESPGNCREDLAEIYRLKGYLDAING
jgi:hypothetical protein